MGPAFRRVLQGICAEIRKKRKKKQNTFYVHSLAVFYFWSDFALPRKGRSVVFKKLNVKKLITLHVPQRVLCVCVCVGGFCFAPALQHHACSSPARTLMRVFICSITIWRWLSAVSCRDGMGQTFGALYRFSSLSVMCVCAGGKNLMLQNLGSLHANSTQ